MTTHNTMREALENFEISDPDGDGLVWLNLHGKGTTGKAGFCLGHKDRLAVQVALLLEQDRRAALAQPAQADAQSGEPRNHCKCPDWCRERCTCAMETIVTGMPQSTPAPSGDGERAELIAFHSEQFRKYGDPKDKEAAALLAQDARPVADGERAESVTQPWYDAAWKAGAASQDDGDTLETITFSTYQFEEFCAALLAKDGHGN